MIIKLLNGDKIKMESEEKREARRKYKEYSLLSIGLKLKRNLNIASNFLKSGPNITNFGNAISALFGGFSPENPDVNKGDPPNVGIKDFTRIVKTAKVARELEKAVTSATKNGRLEVTSNYFNSPNNWYRVTETPEKFGILELGRNITTRDNSETIGTVDSWRRSIIKNYTTEDGSHFKIVPGTGNNEGYFIKTPDKHRFSLSKLGAAHGNTSQAAKGQIWGGTFAYSGKFPGGVLEGQAPTKIFRGMTETGADSRTNFILQDWDNVPLGARVGFHTGEMPMSNLGWFQRTKNGTYTYEPIIPEKRIEIKPSTKLKRVISEGTYPWYRGRLYSVKEVVNPDGTVNPRQAMKILHEVSEQFPGSYKMEHRLENPEWHQNDPTTYQHTKNVARSAWNINPPLGFTKQDLMIAALGHDFGKIVAGDGHAQIGADLAKQVFPDLTDAQYTAIVQHMGIPTTPLGKVTKLADISNGRHFYSGYTPTKQSSVLSKFVKDVMLGHKWGMNRETKPIGNKDFTKLLEGKERIGYGAETSVYEHPTNPLQVLKVYPSGSNGFSSPQEAMLEGLIFTNPLNNLPYNLPVNLEGTLKRHGSYFPVFSQRRVYIPLIDLAKIIDFDKSVNGMYSLEKPNINNILLENGIQGAKDFKLSNLGLLSDGTVMGIDLWRKGGKMNAIEQFKQGSKIHIKKENRGKFTKYCHGKVTDECIRKAKASGNPTLVKRATFAANARKWKHQEGGVITNSAAKLLAKGWYDGTIGGFINMGKAIGKEVSNLFSSKGGTFGGGSTNGSGATMRWIPAYKPKNKGNFNTAFDEARNAGAETFMFGNKEYSTVKEANPIREFNNRFVGAGRTEQMIRDRGVYGKDYGPITGTYSYLPRVLYARGGRFLKGGKLCLIPRS